MMPNPEKCRGPQINPEMIPVFLVTDPEVIPVNLGNGDKTWGRRSLNEDNNNVD